MTLKKQRVGKVFKVYAITPLPAENSAFFLIMMAKNYRYYATPTNNCIKSIQYLTFHTITHLTFVPKPALMLIYARHRVQGSHLLSTPGRSPCCFPAETFNKKRFGRCVNEPDSLVFRRPLLGTRFFWFGQ